MTKVNNVSLLLFPGHISQSRMWAAYWCRKVWHFHLQVCSQKKNPKNRASQAMTISFVTTQLARFWGPFGTKMDKTALTDDTCYPVTRLLSLYCTYRTRRTRGACIALKTQRKQNINHCGHVATNKNDRKETGGRNTALNFTRGTISGSKLPLMTSSNSSSWSNNEGGKWYKKEKQRIE